jgi:hypothetical protein
MKLTEKERERLLTKNGVPEHMSYWARSVALTEQPTEQQINTVKELFALKSSTIRHGYWIYEDKLRFTKVSYHTIRQKKAHS